MIIVIVSLLIGVNPRAQLEPGTVDYPNVAMLACLLGCDALFEHGYMTVDDSRIIAEGRHTTVDALANARAELIGSPCPAFTPGRAAAFKAHRQLHRTRTAYTATSPNRDL